MQNPISLNPSSSGERIQSIDVMRGFVLFGILLMNINSMGLYHAYNDPTVTGGYSGWNLYTWITTNMFFEGTMRALFSMLFGVGMFVLLDRLERKGAGINAANIYFRRLTWLLVFGLIHGYLLLWYGEVLYEYALMGFLVFSFRSLAPKTLLAIATVLFLLGSVWSFTEYREELKFTTEVEQAAAYKASGKPLTDELKAADEKMQERMEQRTPAAIAKHNANMRKGYISVVKFLAPKNTEYNQTEPYRYDLFDVLSMMLIGIALFKLNVLSAAKSYRFYTIMILIGYSIGLTVNYFEVSTIIRNNFSPQSFARTNITYDLGRIAIATGHIGSILLLCKLPILEWFKNMMAAVGKMALTNYLMHSIIAMFLFTGAGFGLFGKLQRYELLYVVFSIWLFQVIASTIWLRYFNFGPAEWLWRYLSYLKKYPLRKTSKEAAATAGAEEALAVPV